MSLLLQSQVALGQSGDSAARAAAIDLFDRAEALMASGHVAEACPKYAESYRLDPQLGALLHLGDCLEREGRLASAYATFRDAVELAVNRSDDRQRYAETRSEQLLPKLSRIAVHVSDSARVPGLRVTLGPLRIDRGSFGVGIAVDPGRHRIEATAPGRATYRVDIAIAREGQLEEVTIPTLGHLPAAAVSPRPELTSTAPEVVAEAPHLAEKPRRDRPALRTAGLVTAGAGVVVLGVGVGFLIDMFSTLTERDAICPSDPCPVGADRSRVQALEADARRSQVLGVVLSSAGGVLTVGGATMAWVVPRVDVKAGASEQASFRLQLGGTF